LDLTGVLTTLNIAGSASLLLRLVYSKLALTYRFLAAFVSFDLLYTLTLAITPMRTKRYGDIYMIGAATELLLAIMVVVELYAEALAEHPALARFGSRTVGYVLLGAGVIAATILGIDNTVLAGQSAVLHRFYRAERTVDFGVLLFLVIISIFLLWFPVRVKRNISCYVGGFAVFYASRSAGLLAVNLLPPGWMRRVDNTMLSVSFVCLMFLALCLRRESASVAMPRNRSNPTAVAQVTEHLESINTALSRLAKR
jgi:hypothetical protein